MTSTSRQVLYGILALAGAAATWSCNVAFAIENSGFPMDRFVADAYGSAASASITNDILVVVVAFLLWSFLEARRLGMRRWWIVPLLTFSVAIAFSFPLFLLLRERRLEELRAQSSGVEMEP